MVVPRKLGRDGRPAVATGVLFHRLTRRSYPHRQAAQPARASGPDELPVPVRVDIRQEDVDAALASLGETFDIDRDDLVRIVNIFV